MTRLGPIEVTRPSVDVVHITYPDGAVYVLERQRYENLRANPGTPWRAALDVLADRGEVIRYGKDQWQPN